MQLKAYRLNNATLAQLASLTQGIRRAKGAQQIHERKHEARQFCHFARAAGIAELLLALGDLTGPLAVSPSGLTRAVERLLMASHPQSHDNTNKHPRKAPTAILCRLRA